MSEEDCYLYAELKNISPLENVYFLKIQRKDLEGNPIEKVIELVAPKETFEFLQVLLELFDLDMDYLQNKINKGLEE